MLRRRLGFLTSALLVVGSLVATAAFHPSQAAANPGPPTGTSDMVVQFLDRGHIEVIASGTYADASGIYYDRDINNLPAPLKYKQGGDKGAGVKNGCASTITVSRSDLPKNGDATVNIKGKMSMIVSATASSGGSKCASAQSIDLSIIDTFVQGGTMFMMGTDNSRVISAEPGFNSSITYFKSDGNTIVPTDNDSVYDSGAKDSYNFKADPTTPVSSDTGVGYYLQSSPGAAGADCAAIAHADNGSPSDAHYYFLKKKNGKCTETFKWTTHAADSAYDDTYNFNNVLVISSRPDAFSTVAPGSASSGTGSGKEDLCPIGTWGLRWLACPLVSAAQEGVQAMDKVLQSLLIINTNETFGTGASGQAYYNGFKAFQSIALSILVIVALIMVVGQAMGFELLDAYTVRKVLPRLVAMVILLVILWPALRYMVQFFDDLTNWTGDIIAAPFRQLGPETKTDVASIAGQYLVGGLGIAAFGIMGILSMAATLFLGILTLIVILLARKLIILICIVTAPVAVVCSILPNTRIVTKVWRDGFFPAEMAGVAIAATEGAGIAAAHVSTAANIGGVGSTVAVIIVIITQFILVIVVRRVGGFFSTVTGVVNDRSRGGFDRLKNFRGNQLKNRGAAMQRGDLYSNTNPFGRAFNSTTRFGTNVARTAPNAGLNVASWGRKYQQTKDQQSMAAAEAVMQSQGFKSINNNDDALMAANYNSTAEALTGLTERFGGDRQRAQNAVAAAQAAGMKIGTAGFKVAAAMQRVSTGTGYTTHTVTDENGRERTVTAMEEMTSTIASAAGGNAALATRMAGFANAETKKVGRNDLAAGFGTVNGLVQSQLDGSRATAAALNNAVVEAARGTDNATLMRNKPESVANITRALDTALVGANQTLQTSRDPEERNAAAAIVAQATAKLNNMQQSGIYAPEVNLQPLATNDVVRIHGPEGQRSSLGQRVERQVDTAVGTDTGARTGTQQVMTQVIERDVPSRGSTRFGGYQPPDPNDPNAANPN